MLRTRCASFFTVLLLTYIRELQFGPPSSVFICHTNKMHLFARLSLLVPESTMFCHLSCCWAAVEVHSSSLPIRTWAIFAMLLLWSGLSWLWLSFQVHSAKFCSTRWHSWLRHCATRRKVASSIPDGVTGIFHWLNPSSRTMAPESTQPLT
jgi:hypothetical protein